MADTGALLRQSHVHHAAYRRAARIPNLAQARESVALALASRRSAHRADPAHTDPEWLNDKAAHDDLMQFYKDYLK